jgi:hypothetical protein
MLETFVWAIKTIGLSLTKNCIPFLTFHSTLFSFQVIHIQVKNHRIWDMSITYISNSAQSKELNTSRWIHTIDIIQLLKAGLTDNRGSKINVDIFIRSSQPGLSLSIHMSSVVCHESHVLWTGFLSNLLLCWLYWGCKIWSLRVYELQMGNWSWS